MSVGKRTFDGIILQFCITAVIGITGIIKFSASDNAFLAF